MFEFFKKKTSKLENDKILDLIANLANITASIEHRITCIEVNLDTHREPKDTDRNKNLLINKEGLYTFKKIRNRRANTDGDND